MKVPHFDVSLVHCSTMVGYVWGRHTFPPGVCTKDCLSILFI
jgi:hypothetical protein